MHTNYKKKCKLKELIMKGNQKVQLNRPIKPKKKKIWKNQK